jgi:heme-degrading monooxygenase HmoA
MSMVTFGLEYVVDPNQPEKEEKFVSAMRDAIKALGSTSGHMQTRFFRDVQRPNAYLVFSEWENRDAFRTFMQSDTFAAATALGREILTERPRHHTFARE